MKKITYEPKDGSYGAFSSIANAQYVLAKSFMAMSDADGFVSLSLSDHLGSSIYIPKEIGSRYMYNKAGQVKSLLTGKILKIHHNEFKASYGGVVYELYMPKNSILASRVEPNGENDDILFRNMKEACEHFKCNYRTIKACLDRSGEKAFKGYYFEYGWPEPYVMRTFPAIMNADVDKVSADRI